MQSQGVRSFQSQASTFEFTKRKRWADLLVTELTEAIILILSSQCQILYCGTAVNELLGWKDEELIDGDFLELINVADKSDFRIAFADSIQGRSDMLCRVRLYCKNAYVTNADYSIQPREVLVEIKGYPHFVDGDAECKCFFATARPFPSRNTNMLHKFMELKFENEILQQKLMELKRETAWTPASVTSPSAHILHYVSGSSVVGGALSTRTTMANPMHRNPSLAPSSELSESRYIRQDMMPSSTTNPTIRSFDAAGLRNVDDDSTSEPVRKKKRVFSSEQYVCVTCGRTDSPEWRKGPHGPKTLCNACGLRWAKKMRKSDDPGEGGTGHDFT